MKHALKHKNNFSTITNCLIVLIVACFLMAPLIFALLYKVGVPFDKESGIMQKTFIVEDRARTRPPTPSLNTFQDGSFQKNMEKAVSDLTPKRDDVLMTNAALQRFFIESANKIFRFKTYHTYFGSSRIYIPKENALMIEPRKKSASLINGTVAFCEGLKKLAKDFPKKRFIVCIMGGYYCTAMNPALDLMSNRLLPDEWANTYKERLKDQQNIYFYTDVGEYKSLNEYFKHYYRSDHHWNMQGVNHALSNTFNMLGAKAFKPVPLETVPDYQWGGTLTKSGLYPLFEDVEIPANDLFTHYELRENSRKEVLGKVSHDAFYNADPLEKKYSFYRLYFNQKKDAHVINAESPTDKVALQVTNSYGAISKFVLGSYYRKVVPFWHILGVSGTHGLNKSTRLRELINKHKADDIYFIATPVNTSKLAVNFPHYFD